MSSFLSVGKKLAMWGLCASIPAGFASHAALLPKGGEFPIAGKKPGDQVFPSLAIGPKGGLLVWQDSFVDGDGLGISAIRVGAGGLPSPSSFKINETTAGDQENPQIAVLKNGGAVVVWQGGVYGFQDIFARIIKPDGTFVGSELRVNSYLENQQITPTVAALENGNAVVLWSSFGQDGHMQGVFGQILSPSGDKVGSEFQVNESTMYNQRTPSVCGLKGGGFAAVWISEKSRGVTTDAAAPTAQLLDANAGRTIFGVDVYARMFASDATSNTGEFLVNTGTSICANPSIAAGNDGGFVVVWGQDSQQKASDSWDVFGRAFDAKGAAIASVNQLNSYTFGDQFAPKVVAMGDGYVSTWTSLGQDGSMEGVVARNLSNSGAVAGPEVPVNTTTASKQMHPTISGDGEQGVIVAWTSFGVETGFDLFAQRYGEQSALPVPVTPTASGLGSSRIMVTWPSLVGYDGVSYDLYVDESTNPIRLSGNHQIITGLAASTAHSFRISYVLANGLRSVLSGAAQAKTWGEDENGDGLPDDWQAIYWPNTPASLRPGANEDSDGDGASNFREFLAGTNPVDPGSSLTMSVSATSQGLAVSWATIPGFIYQLQTSTDSVHWTDVGDARFAAGATDMVLFQPSNSLSLFRVIRIR